MLKRAFSTAAMALGLLLLSLLLVPPGSNAQAAPKDIRWGTGPVGSSGGKALVVLTNFLAKQMPELRFTVLPYPGAVGTVKGFATGDLDGYYGSDVALKELAADTGRF